MSNIIDILDIMKGRIPDRTNVYPVFNNVMRMLHKRLFQLQSSLVIDSFSLSMSSGDIYVACPSDFWGLIGKPYVSGKKHHLDPIPDLNTKLFYSGSNSTALYYEIRNFKLYLYPPPNSSITVKGDYFIKPTVITKPTDTIPWNGLLDDIIQEAVVMAYMPDNQKNPAVLQNYISEQVDSIIPYIDKKQPVAFNNTAQLDLCMEDL